ncbi:MAG: extracellular solute-binding protein [Clostridia bacterium]|nr:extracellular solute-binding protein [Clostridia bacterium]
MTKVSRLLRVAALTLAVMLSLALFAGCKKDKDTASSKEASQVTTSMDNTEIVDQYADKNHPTLPKTMDLGGFEMTFATPSVKTIIPEEGSSPEGDLILETLREAQEKYNFTVLVMQIEQDGWDEAMTAIVAGEQYANVMMPCIHQSGGFLQSRLCADYLQTDIAQYIDMNQPWWNDTMAYASNVLGSVYAGASAIQSPADSTYVVYFNKTLAGKLGIGENELYDLWDKKEWTWDAFVKYAKMANKDLDGNGSVDSINDQWGYVAPGYDSAQAFCSSAKVASVTTTDGMNPTYTFNTTHAITTLTKLNQLFTTDKIYCLASWDNTNRTYLKMFSAGQALFFTGGLGSMTGEMIRDMEDDWGLLTYPLGPKEGGGWQDKYMSRVDHNFRLCLIPSTVEDKASTAFVLEAMTFNYFKIINEKVDTYATLYCRDDKSVEIANTVYNTSTYEISQFLYSINNGSWNSQIETKIRSVVQVTNYDVSGEMNTVADLGQQMINDYFNGI